MFSTLVLIIQSSPESTTTTTTTPHKGFNLIKHPTLVNSFGLIVPLLLLFMLIPFIIISQIQWNFLFSQVEYFKSLLIKASLDYELGQVSEFTLELIESTTIELYIEADVTFATTRKIWLIWSLFTILLLIVSPQFT